MPDAQLQMFGGGWTEQKLDVLRKYLAAYTTALKKQPFAKLYVDAFAGTGYREEAEEPAVGSLLFSELAAPEAQRFLDGSAKIALDTAPGFDRFLFIEASTRRAAELAKLKGEHTERMIDIVVGDANAELVKLANVTNWASTRAVLFLDPYGMQVEWRTMEAVARKSN